MRTVEEQWNVPCCDWSQIRPGWGSRLSVGAKVVARSVTAMAVQNANSLKTLTNCPMALLASGLPLSAKAPDLFLGQPKWDL